MPFSDAVTLAKDFARWPPRHVSAALMIPGFEPPAPEVQVGDSSASLDDLDAVRRAIGSHR